MTTEQGTTRAAAAGDADRELKSRHRAMWALGDFHRVAKDVVWDLGPVLVEASGISAGQRVLDVGAGTGNAAIRAAEAGAKVVASDLTPELFEAGRRETAAQGVEIDWVEADAEALPFADGEFDVVISSIGAMFAPHHQATADELLRVCRPGGTIGMINWTPEGTIGHMFRMFAPYAPSPPPDAQPPVMWGSEEHVRELFGDRVESLDFERRQLMVDHFAHPAEACEHAKQNFGPTIAAYANVSGDPDRVAALERDFVRFAEEHNRADPDGPAIYHYEYLLVVARKRN